MSSTPSTTRDKLLAAVVETVAEHGLAGCKMERVALQAGVAVGTLYRYFPNKRALINAAYVTYKAASIARLSPASVSDLPYREAFEQLWIDYARYLLDERKTLSFLAQCAASELLSPASRALGSELMEAARMFFRKGTATQLLLDLPVSLQLAEFTGVAQAVADDDTGVTTVSDEYLQTAAKMVWRGLACEQNEP